MVHMSQYREIKEDWMLDWQFWQPIQIMNLDGMHGDLLIIWILSLYFFIQFLQPWGPRSAEAIRALRYCIIPILWLLLDIYPEELCCRVCHLRIFDVFQWEIQPTFSSSFVCCNLITVPDVLYYPCCHLLNKCWLQWLLLQETKCIGLQT